MKISGLQKLTLLDYPEKIACTVFTPGCNFRCPFCHNASLVLSGKNTDEITEKDFFDFLSTRVGILEGVCITGGEPTLQNSLVEFIKKIKDMGFFVKLDTNGYKPDVLIDLVNNKLIDYVAMDIKNCPDKYSQTIGLDEFDIDNIKKSVDFLLSSSIDFEFRTTVVKELHTAKDFEEISKWLEGTKKYYLQCFKDSGDLICSGFSSYNENEMNNLLNIVKNRIPSAQIRGL